MSKPILIPMCPGLGHTRGGWLCLLSQALRFTFINDEPQQERCGSSFPAPLWVLHHRLLLLMSSLAAGPQGSRQCQGRSRASVRGQSPPPPKSAPEMQSDENHPSAGWSPSSLSSDLALGGGESLEGEYFTPTTYNPPSLGTTRTQQHFGGHREDLLGKHLVPISTTLSFLGDGKNKLKRDQKAQSDLKNP